MGKKMREQAGVVVLGFAVLLGCAGLFGCATSARAPKAPRRALGVRDRAGNLYVAEVHLADATLSVAKRDASGGLVWARTETGGARSASHGAVAVGSDGAVVVAWTVPGPSGAPVDSWVRKYDASGRVLWTRTAGCGGADFGERVTVLGDGTVILGGRMYEGHGRFVDFARRFDADGNPLDAPSCKLARAE
jgi:hypothetical protein